MLARQASSGPGATEDGGQVCGCEFDATGSAEFSLTQENAPDIEALRSKPVLLYKVFRIRGVSD